MDIVNQILNRVLIIIGMIAPLQVVDSFLKGVPKSLALCVIFLEQTGHGFLHEKIGSLVFAALDPVSNEFLNFRGQSDIHNTFLRQVISSVTILRFRTRFVTAPA